MQSFSGKNVYFCAEGYVYQLLVLFVVAMLRRRKSALSCTAVRIWQCSCHSNYGTEFRSGWQLSFGSICPSVKFIVS
jgi:hypothetical protein